MSADNGVYILKTPARPIKNGNLYTNQHGKFEYRVAHCQAIDKRLTILTIQICTFHCYLEIQ